MRLEKMVAVITGGASGFGAEMCRVFTREGAAVAIADIDATKGEALAAELNADGHQAWFCLTDVTRSDHMGKLAAGAAERFGRIDVMVNNAGISHPNTPMLEVSEAMFDRVMQVNVKSVYLSAVHFLPHFRKQGSGAFINIGSTAAVRPRPGLSWYSASKGAVALLTKAMAVELGPEKIRVNCINPALAETPLLATFLGGNDSPEVRSRFLPSIPIGRFGRPSDVANAALFLAERTSEFITGVCLEVDGGRCI
jgi:3-oxoacyl-[acyl-carrier protein] reductase